MQARAAIALALSALLLGAAPAWAQDESPAPIASDPPAQERRDLYLDMPYTMGGFDPGIVMTRGEEHFADLPAGDQARVELETLLDAVGGDVEAMVSGYALVSVDDLFAFVVAIRVPGIEPGSLLPAYLPIPYGDLADPSRGDGTIGGKDVVIISSIGDDDVYVDLYVYDEGDTVWMLQGPFDVVETTLRGLPPPI